MATAKRTPEPMTSALLILGVLLVAAVIVVGCSKDDCVSCVEPAPVAPTYVYSESGDGQVTLYWSDFPEIYNAIDRYQVFSRFYTNGDENDPNREFFLIGEVPVGENFDPDTHEYHYVDDASDVQNGVDLEYAVRAVATNGQVGDLSYELVIDTPLPMSETPIEIFDANGAQGNLGGFDFSLQDDGRVDPNAPGTSADVQVVFRDGVPYLEAMRTDVHLQDLGVFYDASGGLDFAGVSWAPDGGYSASGVLEIIADHVYVVEIVNEPQTGDLHYAKFGVAAINQASHSVLAMWAYQLVNGLPELSAPETSRTGTSEFAPIKL